MSLKRSRVIALAICLVLVIAVLVWGVVHFGAPGKKPAPALVAPQTAIAPLQDSLASIVANYRKIIVLLDDEKSLDQDRAAAADTLGRSFFYENQKLLKELTEKLSAELEGAGSQSSAAVPPGITHFLNELENEPDWHDADKLAFSETMEDLIEAAASLPEAYRNKSGLMVRLGDDRKALKEIQSLYDRELDKIFGRFETRGMVVHREAWEKYVAYLKTKFTRDKLLGEYPGGAGKKPAPPQGKGSGGEFPPKSLVLTFDDGPHLRYTPRIVEILKNNGVKGVFFELGSNIGSFKPDDTIRLAKAAKVSQTIVASGFYLANHSYSHAFLPKLAEKEMIGEIERTNRL
jgi:hypothetical protein